jgi:hypothetical protein
MIDVDDVRVRRFLVSALELRPARKVRRAVGMGTPGDGKAVSAKLAELNRNAVADFSKNYEGKSGPAGDYSPFKIIMSARWTDLNEGTVQYAFKTLQEQTLKGSLYTIPAPANSQTTKGTGTLETFSKQKEWDARIQEADGVLVVLTKVGKETTQNQSDYTWEQEIEK